MKSGTLEVEWEFLTTEKSVQSSLQTSFLIRYLCYFPSAHVSQLSSGFVYLPPHQRNSETTIFTLMYSFLHLFRLWHKSLIFSLQTLYHWPIFFSPVSSFFKWFTKMLDLVRICYDKINLEFVCSFNHMYIFRNFSFYTHNL